MEELGPRRGSVFFFFVSTHSPPMDAAGYGNYGYGHFTVSGHGQAFRHRVCQGNSLVPDAKLVIVAASE